MSDDSSSEYEGFFDNLTELPDDMTEADSSDLEKNIKKLRDAISHAENEKGALSVQVKNVNAELEPISSEEEILMRQLAEVRERKAEKRREADAAKRAAKRWEDAIVEAQRKLQTFMSEKALRDDWDNLSEQLDRDTINAPWREFAYSHQIEGAKRLATAGRAICGDKRGLGKTLTSLIYLDMRKSKKVLIFTPRDVSGNFLREIKHWAPNRPSINMVGMDRHTRDFMYTNIKALEEITVVLNYEAWRRDPTVIGHLKLMQFDTIIIDEAHNLKNSAGQAFKGIREIVRAVNKCPYCGEGTDGKAGLEFEKTDSGAVISVACKFCFQKSERGKSMDLFRSVRSVLPMSGTTIINRPQDIWPLLNLVDPDTFFSLSGFLQDYAYKDYSGKWVFDYGGQDRLIRKLGSRFIGRTPETAGVKIPPQEQIIHEIDMDYAAYPEQVRVMREIMTYGAIKFDKDTVMSMPAVIAEITRRRQAAVWPAGIVLKDAEGNPVKRLEARESIKLDKCEELMTSIVQEEEEPVIIFSMFKEALIEMERRCKNLDISCVRYDGDTPEKMRDEIQLDFDIKTAPKFADKKWKVFLGQYKSAATGLNLTAARQMILIDRNWSPANEDQAVGRINRLDSDATKTSLVHILHLNKLEFEPLGIDDFMAETMDIKAKQINGFEGANDAQEALFRKLMGEE